MDRPGRDQGIALFNLALLRILRNVFLLDSPASSYLPPAKALATQERLADGTHRVAGADPKERDPCHPGGKTPECRGPFF